jgi:hypothetical protein
VLSLHSQPIFHPFPQGSDLKQSMYARFVMVYIILTLDRARSRDRTG